MNKTQLKALAKEARDCITKAETGRVDAYIEAGEKLNAAKAEVRKIKKLNWGDWLKENSIPQRTATRAMQYAKDPKKYRAERVKDALEKKKARKKNGQMSDQKKKFLSLVMKAKDDEISALYRLVAYSEADVLKRLRDIAYHYIPSNKAAPKKAKPGPVAQSKAA
jgi:hypothetical protein